MGQTIGCCEISAAEAYRYQKMLEMKQGAISISNIETAQLKLKADLEDVYFNAYQQTCTLQQVLGTLVTLRPEFTEQVAFQEDFREEIHGLERKSYEETLTRMQDMQKVLEKQGILTWEILGQVQEELVWLPTLEGNLMHLLEQSRETFQAIRSVLKDDPICVEASEIDQNPCVTRPNLILELEQLEQAKLEELSVSKTEMNSIVECWNLLHTQVCEETRQLTLYLDDEELTKRLKYCSEKLEDGQSQLISSMHSIMELSQLQAQLVKNELQVGNSQVKEGDQINSLLQKLLLLLIPLLEIVNLPKASVALVKDILEKLFEGSTSPEQLQMLPDIASVTKQCIQEHDSMVKKTHLLLNSHINDLVELISRMPSSEAKFGASFRALMRKNERTMYTPQLNLETVEALTQHMPNMLSWLKNKIDILQLYETKFQSVTKSVSEISKTLH